MIKLAPLVFFTLIGWSLSIQAGDFQKRKQYRHGAVIYHEYCMKCHGRGGMGDGVVSLSMENYPANVNLLSQTRKTQDLAEIKEVVSEGNNLAKISSYMPPWKSELSALQIDAVSELVNLFREDTEQALGYVELAEKKHLKREIYSLVDEDVAPSVVQGKLMFDALCAICHLPNNARAKRMQQLLTVKPNKITSLSSKDRNYLFSIISEGGDAVGKSSQMPPWAGQLQERDIDYIIDYLLSLQQ